MPTRKLPPLPDRLDRHALLAPSGPGPRLQDAWQIPLAQLVPNPWQPRRRADPARLQELATDITARGVLEPLIVRPLDEAQYQIIAGERRFRAAGLAGLAAVPCLVRDVDETEARAIALVENLQREDLDIEDEAVFLRELHDSGLSLRDIGSLIHKSHQYVQRRLRLVQDPAALAAYRAGHLDLDDLVTHRAGLGRRADGRAAGSPAGGTPTAAVTERYSDAPGSDAKPAPHSPPAGKAFHQLRLHLRRIKPAELPAAERQELRLTVADLIGELTALAQELEGASRAR